MRILLLLCLISTSSLKAQIITDNQLIYYQFDGDATDSSINAYDAIISGVTFGEDRFGNPNSAAYFDGVDDFLELPNVVELKPDLPVSFSFWIKYESDNYQDRAVFNTSFEDDRSSGIYFNTQIATGNFAINYGDGTYNYISTTRRTYTSNKNITTNNWHQVVAIVRGPTDMSIYVDCVEYGGEYSGTGGNLVYSITPGNLGRRDRNLGVPALYFNGKLDDFRYWDRELTASEVAVLCNPLSVPESELKINTIQIYPNPTSEILIINSDHEFNSIVIYNTLGQKVYETAYQNKIDISALKEGLYYISLIKNEVDTIKKFVVIHK